MVNTCDSPACLGCEGRGKRSEEHSELAATVRAAHARYRALRDRYEREWHFGSPRIAEAIYRASQTAYDRYAKLCAHQHDIANEQSLCAFCSRRMD